jgi:hypothetical protein
MIFPNIVALPGVFSGLSGACLAFNQSGEATVLMVATAAKEKFK